MTKSTEKITDKCRKKVARNLDLWIDCKREFLEKIKLGPTNVCVCCGGLWFQDSIQKISLVLFTEKCKCLSVDDLLINGEYGSNQIFCNTCRNSVLKNRIPNLAIKNGFMYPIVPSELEDLTSLEERLCALRLPFMQIRSLGVRKQYGLKGNVINILNTIEDTASVLPRRFDNSSTIQLQLMRRLQYKHAYMFETIRPAKVYTACEYLCNTEIYKEENVVLSDDWKGRMVEETLPFIADESDKVVEELKVLKIQENSQDDDEPVNPGGNETLLFNVDDLCSNQAIRYAPGENKRPLSLISDIYAEELAFPTIYCGQKRDFKIKVSYSDIAKSEARRYDRRGCLPHKLLYSYKVQTTHHINNAISMCLRKKRCNSITAKELLNAEIINNMIQHDDGFKLLKTVRSSPAYWENKQKNVMAMIRQLGIPTFFITLSAAETHWPELLVILKKVLDGVEIEEQVAMDLPYNEKADLIRRDPITCARYFDWRFRLWRKYILLAQGGIFTGYKVVDFYFRVEFQHRGSPHIHGVVWVEGAPKFIENSESVIKECITFINEFISCQANVEGVIHQSHKHTTTCERKMKSGNSKCRFGMPYPPMKETKIFLPISDETPKAIRKKLFTNFNKLQDELDILHNTSIYLTFEDFLRKINMDEKEYEMAIRSSLSRPTVFLKRNVDSVFENAYNEKIAKVWRSNMDIQFILDAYACVRYCISYIAKSCRGMSKLLRTVVDDVNYGNLSIKEKLRRIGNVFLNSTEVSAQEAAYTILGMSLSMCSRDAVFIPTGLPEERIYMTKSSEELKCLSPESNDVIKQGLLDHYIQRPDELDEICLADFAAWYTFSTKSNKFILNQDNEFEEFEVDLQEKCKLKSYPLKNYTGFIKERSKSKVIRFRRYNKCIEEDNYYREQVMLYMPWRNEEMDIINQNKKEIYLKNIDVIEHNAKKYEIQREIEDITIMTEDIEEYTDLNNETDEEGLIYDIEDIEGDIGIEMGIRDDKGKAKVFNLPNLLNEEDYCSLMRKLNNEQRKYMYHVLNSMKLERSPWYNLVCGGAGTGKSFLINAIVQSVTRYINSIPGTNPSSIKILLCAPTGKAACNIGGTTLHEAFCLPLSQYKGGMPKLTNDFCNSIASKLNDLKLIIIDEVSMQSLAMFYQINERLQQIFNSKDFFGGISLLLVGDFHQLKPVAGSFVFSHPKGVESLAGNILWDQFSLFELTEIMRQKNDLLFANALNRMATGYMTYEDIELLSQREVCKVGDPPKGAIRLFYDNASVENFNTNILRTMIGEEIDAVARDNCKGKGTSREAILESTKSLNIREAQGLPYKVTLKLGVKYMITANIDVADGLVNGATGILKKIIYGTINGEKVPRQVFILFDTIKSGMERRRGLNRLEEDTDSLWTPIVPITKIIKNWEGRNLSVSRKQFPLVVAEAITVHKSQGGTFESVVIKPSRWMNRAALYVACSRVTNLSGLFIDGEFNPPAKASDNDPVEMELKRLRNKGIQLSYHIFGPLCNDSIKILFHNVQSLYQHYEDVITDQQYQNCDVIIFAETWSLPEDLNELPNYTVTQRLDCTSRKGAASKGIMMFSNNNSTWNIEATRTERQSFSNGVVELGTFRVENVHVIYGYKSPKVIYEDFKNVLMTLLHHFNVDQKICLVGDFNLQLNTIHGKDLLESISVWNIDFKYCDVPYSTNLKTQIDVCLSNITSLKAWYGESYWSYHKPLFLSINSRGDQVESLNSSLQDMKICSESTVPCIKRTCLSTQVVDKPQEKSVVDRSDEITCQMRMSRHDLETLNDGQWLSDEVINSYSHYLIYSYPKPNEYVLNTFFFWRDFHHKYQYLPSLFPSNLLNHVELENAIIYVPSFHIDHWFLVKIDIPSKSICVMDSYFRHVDVTDHINRLTLIFERLTNKSVHSFPIQHLFQHRMQNNNDDCGCYTLKFLEMCLTGNLVASTPINIAGYRNEIKEILCRTCAIME